MRLLTKELISKIPKLYETEAVPLEEKVAYVKLFHPASNWTWYVIEYDGQDTCWGLVDGHEMEFGYFLLSELNQPLGTYRLTAERDKWFRPTTVQDLPIYAVERLLAI